MNQPQTNNFWLLLEVLARRRGLIISVVLIATLATAGLSLMLPTWYRANALLLPPKEIVASEDKISSLREVVSVVQGLNLPVMVTASDVFARMLESRTICDVLITKFDLIERYEVRTNRDAYKELMELSDFVVTDEGLLEISVEDQSPEMAADLANTFVSELDRVSREIAQTRASQNREFVQARVEQVRVQLDSAKADFQQFQIRNHTVDFKEQTRLAVELAIELKKNLADIEISLQVLKRRLGPNHADLVDLKHRRQVVLNQLTMLESQNSDSSFFSLPIADIPALRGTYATLQNRVIVNEKLHNSLLEQLEQAKIAENESAPTISILDPARPPENKSRPKRTYIVGGAAIISLVLSVLLAALLEFLARLKTSSPDDYHRVNLFINAFFGWLPGVRRPDKT